jgi:hypothetical protein
MVQRPHPTDQLIRELIATLRPATPGEVAAIIARMANVPFDRRVVKVPLALREIIGGTTADSLTYHLTKRTVGEQQWADGTTAADYLDDLRRAVLSPTARFLAYARRGGDLAACFAPTSAILPPERRGIRQEENLLVVYSVDRGLLLTGYQFSALAATGVPEDALWLN